MAADGVIISFDIGTTGCKAVALSHDRVVLAEAYASYPTRTTSDGVMEQAPEDWWQAVLDTGKKLREALSQSETAVHPILAIAVSGQMQSTILLDGDGHVLHPAMLYGDTRATVEATALEGKLSAAALKELTGNWKGAASIPSKWLWAKSHVAGIDHTSFLLLSAADFVCFRICGVMVTDYTNASTTGLLNPTTRNWATEILKETDLLPSTLPALHDICQPVGQVQGELRACLLLDDKADVPVFHAGGDVGTTTVGAGAALPGSIYCYLGTSAWVAMSQQGYIPPTATTFTLLHPHAECCIQAASMVTAGGNIEWWRDICKDLAAHGRCPNPDVDYGSLEQLALSSSVGAGGLLYLPCLAGERSPFTDAAARGTFIGLSRSSTAGDMCRAVYEGICYAIRSLCQALGWHPGLTAPPLHVVGGCSHSQVLMQVLADVLGCPVHVAQNSQTVGATGAGIIAGVGIGWFTDLSIPAQNVGQVVTPNADHHAQYNLLYATYETLYPTLCDTFHALAVVRETLASRNRGADVPL